MELHYIKENPIRAVALIAVFGAAVAGAPGCGGGHPMGAPDAGGAPDAEPPPDDASPPDAPPGSPCDPVTQAGCTAVQKCSIVPGDPPGFGCVPRVGDQGAMQSCNLATQTTPDDCAPGLVCRGGADPICLAFCSDAPVDTCPDGEVCLIAEDLDGDLIGDVKFCAQTCDVLVQDCGSAGISCYPSREGAICAPEGAGSVPALEGELCEFANSCAEGLGCFRVGASPDWICFSICDLAAPSCGANQFCNPFEDESWGFCVDF